MRFKVVDSLLQWRNRILKRNNSEVLEENRTQSTEWICEPVGNECPSRSENVRGMTFSPDGHHFATRDSKIINVWRTQDPSYPVYGTFSLSNPISLQYNEDSRRLLIVYGLQDLNSTKYFLRISSLDFLLSTDPLETVPATVLNYWWDRTHIMRLLKIQNDVMVHRYRTTGSEISQVPIVVGYFPQEKIGPKTMLLALDDPGCDNSCQQKMMVFTRSSTKGSDCQSVICFKKINKEEGNSNLALCDHSIVFEEEVVTMKPSPDHHNLFVLTRTKDAGCELSLVNVTQFQLLGKVIKFNTITAEPDLRPFFDVAVDSVAVCTKKKQISIFENKFYSVAADLKYAVENISCIAISPNGNNLLIADKKKTLICRKQLEQGGFNSWIRS